MPLIGHILIGVPASGKSTFARELAKHCAGCLISTDQIRGQLYGDERIQGSWPEIFAEVERQFAQAIKQGMSPVYDATNVKRVWRISLLEQLRVYAQVRWIGWWIQTPLNQALIWNQRRSRRVPSEVIRTMYQQLMFFPPWLGEGFYQVVPIQILQLNWQEIKQQIEQIQHQSLPLKPLSPTCSPTQPQRFHAYSQLIDFERLMNLLTLLIHQPQFQDLAQVQEISSVMNQRGGACFSSPLNLSLDLQWLKINHLFTPADQNCELTLTRWRPTDLNHLHPYSQVTDFTRLIKLIRFLLHHPRYTSSVKQLIKLKPLNQALIAEGIIQPGEETLIYQDMKTILCPYQLLSPF